ncbi:MAG: amino acid ABC transporter permease [Solirubrobacterales bacterium]
MEVIIQQYFDLNIITDNWDKIMEGFWQTVQLSLIGGVLSLIWGLVLSLIRQLPGRAFAPLRGLAIAYIDVFRGIPLLLVLLLVSTGLSAITADGVIPEFIGQPTFFGKPSPFWYGVYALVITYGAYMAEVYRAGLEAVPRGQMEAARSLGMSHGQAMRHIIVPQAVTKVIPPLLNDYIALMKDTSLVSFIGFVEVVQAGSDIQSETFKSSALTMGAVLFLLTTIPLARIVDKMISGQSARTQRAIP